MGRNDDQIRCSFCNKSQAQVKKLIAGPNDTYICDECVEVCSEIIEEVVLATRKMTHKSVEELMEMSKEELSSYFHDQKYSRKELLDLLYTLEIRPGSSAKKNLTEFTISEISEIGMYKRVAKGNHV